MNYFNKIQTIDTGAGATQSNNDQRGNSPSPPYLKLISDCWEQIFDYLSLRDIHAMGETNCNLNSLELQFELIGKEV